MGISFFERVAIIVIFSVLRLSRDLVMMTVRCEFEVNVLANATSLWADGVDNRRKFSLNISTLGFLGTNLHTTISRYQSTNINETDRESTLKKKQPTF